jgi:predicted phage terminase large subunit-like protein
LPPSRTAYLKEATARYLRTIERNEFIPHVPHPKQSLFLLHDDEHEILYGGAAGGGKTDALLMAALQYVHVPGYAALILMKTYADLALPGAGMSRAMEWLSGKARPVEGGKEWRFPSGATLTFGYLQSAGDEQRYRTAQFQYVAFDELTRFPEAAYRFLFSRTRRLDGANIPIRMRAATNPGGPGHEWVKERFIPDEYLTLPGDARFGRCWRKGGRLFVPARRHDNPSLDQAEYGLALSQLLPVERAQQDEGDWSAHAEGHFRPHWFRSYVDIGDAWVLERGAEVVRKDECFIVAACDPAGGTSESADYTACVAAAVTPSGAILILDVMRERIAVERVVGRLADFCLQWRPMWLAIEDAFQQSAYIRQARNTFGVPTLMRMEPGKMGGKLVRATPAILRAENGLLHLPERRPHWMEAYRAELCGFTGDPTKDAHDDQVDATAYLVLGIDRSGGAPAGDSILVTGRRRGQ